MMTDADKQDLRQVLGDAIADALTPRWKFVPVDPNAKMLFGTASTFPSTSLGCVWGEMMRAAPSPADDDALVERFARLLYPVAFDRERYRASAGDFTEAFENAQARALEAARDILRKLGEGI